MPRNRSTEARAAGRVLRAFEITAQSDQAIAAIAAHLSALPGRTRPATRVEAVEWALSVAEKKIRKSGKNPAS